MTTGPSRCDERTIADHAEVIGNVTAALLDLNATYFRNQVTFTFESTNDAMSYIQKARRIVEERLTIIRDHIASAGKMAAPTPSESERKEIPPALLHSVREKWSAMGARYERAKSNWHNEMPGDWPVEVVMTMAELRALAVLPGSVPSSDVGTVKLLTDLLDRGYKMHVMAGTTTHLSAQDSDQNDPLLAWLSDVRSVLYGKTKPTPTVPTAGERPEGK